MTRRWVTEREIAELIGVSPVTLRKWRVLDARDGKRRGGLIWRRFGRCVRYLLTPDLMAEGAAGEVVHDQRG